MTRLCWLAVLLASGSCGSCQSKAQRDYQQTKSNLDYDSGTMLWQGFDHLWSYNHRLNRLGDLISDLSCAGPACQGTIEHTGASGSGADTVGYTSYYKRINAKNVGFLSTTQTLELKSKEGANKPVHLSVSLPAPSNLQARKKYIALLNGFDLVSNRDADKLKSFALSASGATYDATSKQITFAIDAMLNVDCDSLECDNGMSTKDLLLALAASVVTANPIPAIVAIIATLAGKLDLTTDYTMTVACVVVGGDDDLTITTPPQPLTNSYTWDTSTEIQLSKKGLVNASVSGDAAGTYLAETLGFTMLALTLDTDHQIQSTSAPRILVPSAPLSCGKLPQVNDGVAE